MIPLVNVSFISFGGAKKKKKNAIDNKKPERKVEKPKNKNSFLSFNQRQEKPENQETWTERLNTRGTQEQLEIYDNLFFQKKRGESEKEGKKT